MSFSYKQVLENPPLPKIVAKRIPKTSPQDLSRLMDYYNEKEVFEARERNIKVLQESRLLQWIFFAIDNNYLIHISITSEEIGKLEGLGMEYGSGKSNLALMIMYVTYKILYEREGYLINDYESTQHVWNTVFAHFFFRDKHFDEYVFRRPKKIRYQLQPTLMYPYLLHDGCIPIIGYDDMQETLGTDKAHSNYHRRLAWHMTGARKTKYKVLVGTMPRVDMLAKWFRMVMGKYEVIIAERGLYEMQRVKRMKMFHSWLNSIVRADYQGETSRYRYSSLPTSVERRYLDWYEGEENKLIEERFGIIEDEEKERKKRVEQQKKEDELDSMETYENLLRALEEKENKITTLDERINNLTGKLEIAYNEPKTASESASQLANKRWGQELIDEIRGTE